MTAPRLTLVGGPTAGLASSRSGGVGASAPAPTPFRRIGWWPPIPAWRSFVTPQGPGIGPVCPGTGCGKRDMVRLAQYDPAIAANSYGCRSCHAVALLQVEAHRGAAMNLSEPGLSEQLALTLAIKGIAPRSK